MKNLTILFAFLFVVTIKLHGQTVRRIDDPHLTAQQERMVFKRWGNFLPNPKSYWWTGGININPHYTLTWSYLAPTQNRRYRSGADIRPLGPYGHQTQRMGLNTAFKQFSDKYREYTDSIAKDATAEFSTSSGLFSTLDPLWRLYYSKELKRLIDYDLESVVAPLSNNERVYLAKTGTINWYDEQMLMMQEKLNATFNQDIDRGSRIINYHNILMDYRKLQKNWMAKISLANKLKGIHDRWHDSKLPPREGFSRNGASDKEIMEAIMHRVNNKTN